MAEELVLEDDDPNMTAVRYCKFSDGSAGKQTYDPAHPQPAPDGCTEIDQAEYEAILAQMEADRQAKIAAEEAAAEAARKAEYDELRAAGFPESTARRISGYTGP